MIKIDFGSGYNPKKGFKTCDNTFSPFLDYVSKDYKIFDKNNELRQNSVDVLYCRNTLHHIKEIDKLLKNFYNYLKNGGYLEIIECRKEFFKNNLLLDNIWYRYINNDKEIFISQEYRDYISLSLQIGFKLESIEYFNEKEKIVLKK